MHVLVVDDDATVRRMVARLLTAAGHHVVGEAEDGAAALEMAGRVRPEMIVTDCQMPRLDGISLVRALREQGCAGRIIMLSGLSDSQVIARARAAGVDQYLIKPLRGEELIQVFRAAA